MSFPHYFPTKVRTMKYLKCLENIREDSRLEYYRFSRYYEEDMCLEVASCNVAAIENKHVYYGFGFYMDRNILLMSDDSYFGRPLFSFPLSIKNLVYPKLYKDKIGNSYFRMLGIDILLHKIINK